MKRVVIALSGGVDSATVLAFCLHHNMEPFCVGFRYGSQHNPQELGCAEDLAAYYEAPFTTFDLPFMFDWDSPLLDNSRDIPEGHYTSENMASTVVPGRNIIFLSILAGYAWSVGANEVAIGIHQGDHAIYPDCRPEFYQAMNLAVRHGTDGQVKIGAPFLHMDKAEIVRWGLTHRVPYHLTWTCYKGGAFPCGVCGSCVERLEAFKKNGVDDPVAYNEARVKGEL